MFARLAVVAVATLLAAFSATSSAAQTMPPAIYCAGVICVDSSNVQSAEIFVEIDAYYHLFVLKDGSTAKVVAGPFVTTSERGAESFDIIDGQICRRIDHSNANDPVASADSFVAISCVSWRGESSLPFRLVVFAQANGRSSQALALVRSMRQCRLYECQREWAQTSLSFPKLKP